MFCLGFQKIAKKDERPEPLVPMVKGLGAGVLAGTGLGLAATLHGHKKYTPEQSADTYNKIKKHRSLDVHRLDLGSGIPAHAKASWMPTSSGHGMVNLANNANPAVVAHELGHAHHLGNMSKTHRNLHLSSRLVGPAAGIGLAAGLANSKDPDKRKWAPAAVLAGSAPTLYQEGRASVHAVHDLNRHLGRKAALRGAGRLGVAFGSYAAIPAAVAYALHKNNKKLEANNKSRK